MQYHYISELAICACRAHTGARWKVALGPNPDEVDSKGISASWYMLFILFSCLLDDCKISEMCAESKMTKSRSVTGMGDDTKCT